MPDILNVTRTDSVVCQSLDLSFSGVATVPQIPFNSETSADGLYYTVISLTLDYTHTHARTRMKQVVCLVSSTHSHTPTDIKIHRLAILAHTHTHIQDKTHTVTP